jgi:small-conductance mechanosensitive channel
LLAFSAVLSLSLLAYIWTYEPPRVVLNRCFFFLVVNLLMTGAVCASLSLTARAWFAHQEGGYPASAFWWIPAILSLSTVLGLFATAPFAIRELGSVGGPACAAGFVFLVVSFAMRPYLVVDRRELARARNARKRNHGQESLKPEPKSSAVGHLARIGLSVYLALMALVMLHEIVLFPLLNLLEKGGKPPDILFGILFGVSVAVAFALVLRSRLMIRTLRMIPLTSGRLLALIIARYCVVAIAMAAAVATTQIIHPARLSGSTAFPMILPGLGLALVSGACALLVSRPEFGMLPYFFVMPFVAGVMSGAGSNITPTFWALVGMVLIALGIWLHHYAIVSASTPYRVRGPLEISDLH